MDFDEHVTQAIEEKSRWERNERVNAERSQLMKRWRATEKIQPFVTLNIVYNKLKEWIIDLKY